MYRRSFCRTTTFVSSFVMTLTFLAMLFAALRPVPVARASAHPSLIAQEEGQVYLVKAGDSLYKIAEAFYGNGRLWPTISAATNAKAQQDSSFASIPDPTRLYVGQKLWIPKQSTQGTVSQPPAQQQVIQSTSASSNTTQNITQNITQSEQSVRFVSPQNGYIVAPKFDLILEAKGVTLEPAGTLHPNSGHLHILIDEDFVDPGEVIINDASHLHLGKGESTTTLNLTPGSHLLRLQFSDSAHMALDDLSLRDTITVTVVGTKGSTEAAPTNPSPKRGVQIVSPLNGATVLASFSVVMEASGVTVEPAGAVRENAGHMHILVDEEFTPAGEVIVNDASHLHFGKGQLTTILTLTPGVHTLRLQLADGAHMALPDAALRDTITVTVAEAGKVTSSASVQFVSPRNGATVSSPVEVVMAADGVKIEPAGEVHENAGHMHILVDEDFTPPGEIIINDASHLHFGKGQLTTTLTLTAGIHVLRLQLANGAHMALENPLLQDSVTVTVTK